MEPSMARGTPSNTLVLFATLTIQSLAAMALLTLPVVAPAVARSLQISAAYVGLYVALVYAGAMTASLMAGAVVRRFGAIWASQLALCLCAAGLFLSVIPSVFSMAAGAVLIGLGYGPITPASSHLLARTTPAHRMSLVFSIKQTGVPLGGLLAGLIVPGLANWINWQAAFAIVGLACVLCALASWPLRASLDADRDPAQRLSFGTGLSGPLRLVFSHRSLSVLAAVSFLFSIAQLSLTSYLVTFLHEDLSMSLVQAGAMLAVAQAAGVGGRMLWGYVSDRFLGATRMLIVLSLLIALCAAVSPFLQFLDGQLLLVLVLVVFGASAVGWNGVYLAEVARQAPKGMASMATGGTLSMTFLGVVVGPPVFGLVAGVTGSYGIAYASLLVPIGICLWLLWRHRTAFLQAPDADE
ncbi:MAG TPA: MFS transporter [Burkholderiaceae bacterium]|nr:MFS transporter [Burkholderiaceae bacterium]